MRFSTIEDAEVAWDDVDGRLHNGLLFKVTPAKEKMPRGKVKPTIIENMKPKRKSPQRSKLTNRSTSCSRTYEGKTLKSFNRSAVLRSHDSRLPLENKSIHKHSDHVTAHSVSCDTYQSPITKSFDTLNCKTSDQQLPHRIRSLLDSFDLSDTESDGSDGEWDFDLIDNPDSIPVQLNSGVRALVPSVRMATEEAHLVGSDNCVKRVQDGSDKDSHSNIVTPSLSAIQMPNENGLIPIRVSEVSGVPCMFVFEGVSVN